jgi:membrane-associated phospholipid phosphatase
MTVRVATRCTPCLDVKKSEMDGQRPPPATASRRTRRGMMESHEAPARTPPGERLADRLAARTTPKPTSARTTAVAALREFGRLDLAVYRAIAETPTPTLDRWMGRLSGAADRSRLWLAIAAVMAAAGGRDARRAAGAGLMAIAVDSAVVNVGFKIAAHRRRPDRDKAGVPAVRQVPMPHSTSFPSGHAASGFAFANAVAQTLPAVAAPLRLLASAVGYSRIHTGVHYPSDVIVGAVTGASVGEVVGWGLWRLRADDRACDRARLMRK